MTGITGAPGLEVVTVQRSDLRRVADLACDAGNEDAPPRLRVVVVVVAVERRDHAAGGDVELGAGAGAKERSWSSTTAKFTGRTTGSPLMLNATRPTVRVGGRRRHSSRARTSSRVPSSTIASSPGLPWRGGTKGGGRSQRPSPHRLGPRTQARPRAPCRPGCPHPAGSHGRGHRHVVSPAACWQRVVSILRRSRGLAAGDQMTYGSPFLTPSNDGLAGRSRAAP